ncbi:MAG: hypothetical protein WCF92_02430 [bacterium]
MVNHNPERSWDVDTEEYIYDVPSEKREFEGVGEKYNEESLNRELYDLEEQIFKLEEKKKESLYKNEDVSEFETQINEAKEKIKNINLNLKQFRPKGKGEQIAG